ncbi:MAG: hypothetical protein QOJ44_108, partial [Acidimicrobiaceae bacterium]|nr:hypothetical protein [Acidimicrobiaceae bacterium]
MRVIRFIHDHRSQQTDRTIDSADPPLGRRRPWIPRVLAVVALAGLSAPAVVGLAAPAATAATSGSLTATFVKTSDWGTGYVANFNIVNGGAPTTGWTLQFQLPGNHTVTSSWSCGLTK